MDYSRLSMPLGEAIFTQRAIRRFRPDPIPVADVRLVLKAAVRAPNGGNQAIGRFLVVTDRETFREFGALYHEAWWAKRRDEGFERREDLPQRYLADVVGDGEHGVESGHHRRVQRGRYRADPDGAGGEHQVLDGGDDGIGRPVV